MTYALLAWTSVLALAGTLMLGAALLLERMESEFDRVPAYVAGALYFLAVVTTGAAIALNVLARGA